ncbi:hypothetical protein Tco_1436098, partial [Tanacetum coccineum]
ISTLEMIIEDIHVRHQSDMKSLLDTIHELKNHKGGPPDYLTRSFCDSIILRCFMISIYVCRGCLSYILYCDDSYLYVFGITMVLLPSGFLEPLYPNMINAQDIKHMIPPTPPRDIEPPVGSPISLSSSSSVGSSSSVRSTTPLPAYPFDESIFTELDNSLWIIPQPLESEPVPEELNKPDAC